MVRYRLTSVPLEQYNSSVRQLNVVTARANALDTELATLRAENEQLRRERDAIRNETLEEAATVVKNMPIQIYRDKGIGPAGRSCKPATFDDAAEYIRNLKEPSDD